MRTTHHRLAALAAATFLAACQQTAEAPKITMPTAAEHAVKYFPIGAGTTHTTTACDKCHSPDAGTTFFLQFNCIGCHRDATNGVISALASPHQSIDLTTADPITTSPRCYTCHSNGTTEGMTREAHSTTNYPIATGPHASVKCGECHGASRSVADLQCNACHASGVATDHSDVRDYSTAAVPGESAAPGPCLQCHYMGVTGSGSGIVQPVSTHPSWREGGGDSQSITSDPHFSKTWGCLYCHPNLKSSPNSWATDFTTNDCDTCHAIHKD